MKYREIQSFTRQAMKGNYARVYAAALLYPAIRLLLQLVPWFLAAVLLACGNMSPRELFFGGLPLWVVFTFLWNVLRFCILTPIKCGSCSWFTDFLGLGSGIGEAVFFRSPKAYLRGMLFFFLVALQRFAALFPFAAAAWGAGICFRNSTLAEDGGMWLFFCVQCLCAAIWAGVYYVRFCIGMAAVPFLYLADPKGSPFAAVRRSRQLLSGCYLSFLGLFCRRLPAALPLVTVPFLLPYLMMNCTLFLQIRIHEWAQKQEEEQYAPSAVSRRTHRVLYTGKLSAS